MKWLPWSVPQPSGGLSACFLSISSGFTIHSDWSLVTAKWQAFLLLRAHQLIFSSVQLLSRVWLFVTPWTACWRAVIAGSISQVPLLVMNVTSVCGTYSDQLLSHCVESLVSVIFCLLVFAQSSHIFFLSHYRCDVLYQVQQYFQKSGLCLTISQETFSLVSSSHP